MMNRKRIYVGAVLLLFFSACDLMGPEFKMEPVPDVILDGTDAVSDGKVALRIGIEGAGMQARTVKPGVNLDTDVTGWELWGGKDSGSETLQKSFSGNSTTLYLETGTWDFTLKGFKGSDLILRGIITGKSISVPDTLSFTVAPVSEDTGTFKMTINLPTGHGITEVQVFKGGAKIDTVTPVPNPIVFEDTYPAGDYYFSFRLYKGTDLYGVVSELVQVRKNLTSETTIPLTTEDLNIAYEITYNLNGGAFAVVVPGYYRSTDADYTLPVPTKTGYNFRGWYKDSVFTGPAVTKITQGSMESMEFYAKWEVITYDITYGLNGGTAGAGTPTSYTVEDLPVSLVNPSLADYDFQGWYEDNGFTGSPVTSIPASSTGNKTFYAKWTATDYGITYELYGGTAGAGTPTSYTVEDLPVSLVNPTRTDYAFKGWYENSTFTGSPVTSIPAGSTGDKDFYAKWLSTNAKLATSNGIQIGGATINGYSATQDSYTLFVNTTTPADKTLTVTAGEAGQTITAKLNTGTPVTLTSGSAHTFSSSMGWKNTIVITVTAPDGVTTKTYTVGYTYLYSGLTWYVSAGGTDSTGDDSTGHGSSGSPCASVAKALAGISAAYNNGNGNGTAWPGGSGSPSSATISISGTITNAGSGAYTSSTTGMILVDGSIGTTGLPPIILTGTTSDKIDATGKSTRVLYIVNGATVTLAGGLTLTGGNASTSPENKGGGVYVSGGTFTMSGGTIYDNTASDRGGGVYSNGTFTMNAGSTISNNTSYYGGGVYVDGGTFTMNDGTIYDNTVTATSSSSLSGGGVYVYSGTFTMKAGTISYNTASPSVATGSGSGGGVSVRGTFTMDGGTISNNTAKDSGGGVSAGSSSSTFTMNGGTISNNTVTGSGTGRGGGGVTVGYKFTMNGGTITGNTAPSSVGSGVYLDYSSGGSFSMKGDAVINTNNDVNFNLNKCRITITGDLTGASPVARITPETYAAGLAALDGSYVSTNYTKFSVTPDGSTTWSIGSDGKLKSP
jgi:uncharacterized repeat protein (TIGR02543 family)